MIETGRSFRPNFFVPGAQKAGSTSLHYYLAAHPQCLMALPKETFYFGPKQESFGIEDYGRYFYLDGHDARDCASAKYADSARVLSRHGKSADQIKAVGEVTPSYLSTPNVPEQIRELLGRDVKFIFLLRNPIDRAFSAYLHMAIQFEELRTPQRALGCRGLSLVDATEQELSGIHNAIVSGEIRTESSAQLMRDPIWNFRYLRNSTYLDDLRRFESEFGRDQMLVLLSEELFQNPIESFRSVAEFLGIDTLNLPVNVGTQYNKTMIPRFGKITRSIDAIARLPGLRTTGLLDYVQAISHSSKREIDTQLRIELSRLFEDHNRELSAYLDRDLSKVWS